MALSMSSEKTALSSNITYFEEPEQYTGPKNVYGTQYISGDATVINGDVFIPRRFTHEKRQRRLDVLEWLSPVSFRSFHETVRQEAGLDCQRPVSSSEDFTGKWLIESEAFKRWEAQELNKLWYHGMPGAGKTVLASTIIEYLSHLTVSAASDTQARRVAYVYLRYTHPQSVEDLLGGLVRQIVQEADVLPQVVLEYYTSEQKKGGQKSALDLSKLLAAISLDQRVYIVIDGLDEYDPNLRQRLTRLVQPSHSSHQISLLFTSRMVHDFEQLSQGFECFNITANPRDIGLFIDREFAASARMQRFSTRDPALQEDIRGQIYNRCNGMFLLAGMHMKTLNDRLTLSDVRKSMHELPTELTSTYDLALKRVLAQEIGKRDLALNVFGWVLHARSPMTLVELQHALALDLDKETLDLNGIYDEEDIRDACTGLIAISRNSVTFVHFTTLKYFRSNAHWNLSGREFHSVIASKCSVYLSLTSQKQPHDEDQLAEYIYQVCYHSRRYNLQTDEYEIGSWPEWQDEEPPEFPFAGYAARHLGDHLRGIRGHGEAKQALVHVTMLLAEQTKRNFLFKLLCCLRRYNTFSTFSNPIIATRKMSLRVAGRSPTLGETTALHFAAFFGWCPLVDQILTGNCSVNAIDATGRTPIVIAIQEGHLDVVSRLLDRGSTIDLSNPHGRHALIHAAQHDQRKLVDCVIIRTLTVFGVDGKMAQPEKMNRNHHFLHLYLLLIIQYLLVLLGINFYQNKERSEGPPGDISLYDSTSQDLRLLSSAGTGNTEGVRELVKRKSFTITNDDFTLEKVALFLAVEFGHALTAQALIEGGIDVNTKDLWGNTPLHRAALRNDIATVEMLLQHNCIVDIPNDRGFTAWSASVRAVEANGVQKVLDGRLTVLNALRKAGADPNQVDCEGCSQLYTAAAGGNVEKVAYLLGLGVDPSWKTQYLWTALHWAASNGHLEVVRMLIAAGAELSPLSDTYCTPLDMAMAESQNAIANVLEAAGAKTAHEVLQQPGHPESGSGDDDDDDGDDDDDDDDDGDRDDDEIEDGYENSETHEASDNDHDGNDNQRRLPLDSQGSAGKLAST